VTSQAAKIKDGQRLILSGAQAEMGYTLPACIGIAFANGKPLGITGDGSLQMNIQELQTLKHHSLNVKLFVLNNNGYLSIKKTQQKFCGGRHIGTDKNSGLSFPDLKKICNAYEIEYMQIKANADVRAGIEAMLLTCKPIICEVMCDPQQEIHPSVSAEKTESGIIPKPFEDMYPFLDRAEFNKEMIVKPISPK
ncbi:MAG: thiamine pyrophosphate-binding protein, partial [Gammaproteobacteria bacterium]|nr:thiamine pyrophosphate-binding protein [Gammaproteobacteria bacterium]